MVTTRLRKWQDKLEPLAKFLTKIKITPNRLSIIGLFFSVNACVFFLISGYFIHYLNATPYFGLSWLFMWGAAASVFFAGLADILDGTVARYQKSITKFGGFLDSVLDRYNDAIILFGIIMGGHCNLIFGIFALMGALFVSYSRAKAESAGVPGKYMATGMERMERLLLIYVFSVVEGVQLLIWSLLSLPFIPMNIPVLGPLLGFYGETLGIAIIILAVLTHATVVRRIYVAHKQLPKTKYSQEEFNDLKAENYLEAEEIEQ